MKRDEAQELADLDVSNIIATKGMDLSYLFIVSMSFCVLLHNGGKQLLNSKGGFLQ